MLRQKLRRTGIPNLIKNKDDTDDLAKSDFKKVELLADYFSSVFIREPDGDIPEETTRCLNTIETCTIDPLNNHHLPSELL